MSVARNRFLFLSSALLVTLCSFGGCGKDVTPTLVQPHTAVPTKVLTAVSTSRPAPSITATTQEKSPPPGVTAPPATQHKKPSPSTDASPATQQATSSPSASAPPATRRSAPTTHATSATVTRKAAPTPTRTPAATATPTPSPTSDPALATQTAIAATANYVPSSGPIGGPEFPPDVNPLTGLVVSDTTALERCPLAIKVSNAPTVVRPQAGLDQADLVFEHYAEGGVTRLTAVFLGQTPRMVGSVRSGRLIDLEIPAMFKAIFAYSGTSAGVGRKYAASDLWPDQLARPGTAGATFYRRDLAKAFEHTLFVNPTTLWAEAERRDINERKDLRGMTFDANVPTGGTAAEDVRVKYLAGISQVQWVHDDSDGRYYRWQGGTAHRDETNGAQLSAANVIVVGANHVNTLILEDTWGGGHWSIEVQIWGEGPVSIFRDGRRYDGIWRRSDRHDLLSFWSSEGDERIPLKPGNSWFQMVPLGFTGLVVAP